MKVKKKAVLAVFLVILIVMGLVSSAYAMAYRRGSSGEMVKTIQTKLKRWGYYTGNIDGVYGSATEEAVRAPDAKGGHVLPAQKRPYGRRHMRGKDPGRHGYIGVSSGFLGDR